MKRSRLYFKVSGLILLLAVITLTTSCATFVAESQTGNPEWLGTTMSAKAKTDINQKDSKGNTALHYAIMRNDEAMVEALLSYKANPDLPNKALKRPLEMAFDAKTSNIFNKLLDAGANASFVSSNGKTLLLRACDAFLSSNNKKDSPYVLSLLEHGADPNDLFTACKTNGLEHYYAYEFLVNSGDSDAKGDIAKAALHAGLDISRRDIWGTTVVFWVLSNSMNQVLKISSDGRTAEYNPENFKIMDLLTLETNYAKLSGSPLTGIDHDINFSIGNNTSYTAFMNFYISSSCARQTVYQYLIDSYKKMILAEAAKQGMSSSSISQSKLTELASGYARETINQSLSALGVEASDNVPEKRRLYTKGSTPTDAVDSQKSNFEHILLNTILAGGNMIDGDVAETIVNKYVVYMDVCLILMEAMYEDQKNGTVDDIELQKLQKERDQAGKSLLEPMIIPENKLN